MSTLEFFTSRTAVLATMHRKEDVIAPLLEQELGLQIVVPQNFNTDRFGTFSREVKRAGSQLEAARIKAQAAMQTTGAAIALASEGAFGPHPAMPYLPCNRELVLLLDSQNQLEIVGEALSTETNFSQTQVKTLAEALEFAERVGFPQHGLVVIAGENAGTDMVTADQIIKGIVTEADLVDALEWALAQTQTAWIETDMRAMYNPTRMQVIRQATENLIAKIKQFCPRCGRPGFEIRERKSTTPSSAVCFRS
ncbi:DUF6671 family protein [Leptolyngbya sp. 7M]|uniref:DUF6671 family protein n=1 Tax=Leptolyngbya sp. 7M TaxID=2812896 RepID=UPI001B8B967D|nr:DUF6671 family protein [Leptolyngbya sp. 7M]QYO65121.1 hypothetical protein JVX88_37425 [Leptolyngbya sp. 7M]